MSFHGGEEEDVPYASTGNGPNSNGGVVGGSEDAFLGDHDNELVSEYLGDGLDVRDSSIGFMANDQMYDRVTGSMQNFALRDKYNRVMRSTLCLYLYVLPIVISMIALFAYTVGAHCGFWLFAEGLVTFSIVVEIGFGFYVLRGEMFQSTWRVVDVVVGLLCVVLFFLSIGNGCDAELDALETVLIVVRYVFWSVRLYSIIKDRKEFMSQGEVTIDERFGNDDFGL